jgi:hypothetical protein
VWRIDLTGVAAETGVVMLVYLDEVYERQTVRKYQKREKMKEAQPADLV